MEWKINIDCSFYDETKKDINVVKDFEFKLLRNSWCIHPDEGSDEEGPGEDENDDLK